MSSITGQCDDADKRIIIRIGQQNVQGSRACQEELKSVVLEKRIDVMLLQEPYSYRGIIPHTSGGRTYAVGERPRSAIIVYNENIEVMIITELSDRHHTCVKLFLAGKSIGIVSSYFQHSEEIGPHIEHWAKCLKKFGNRNLILAGDVNAKSLLWYSVETDCEHNMHSFEKGAQLEELILEKGLRVCNAEGHLPTYAGLAGRHQENNIDITVCTPNIRIDNWNVQDAVNSDHRLITFNYSNKTNRATKENQGKFNYTKADWDKFTEQLRYYTELPNENAGDLDSEVTDIMTSILAAAEDSIPRFGDKRMKGTWWNRELDRERRKVQRLRRRIYKAINIEDQAVRKNMYRKARNKYYRMIKRIKTESWMKFVTEQGNLDPWGLPYRVTANKMKREQLITSMRIDGEYVTDINKLAEKVLDKLLPSQTTATFDYEHRIEALARACTAERNSSRICEDELRSAAETLGRKKAPGYDEITIETILRGWPIIKDRLLDIMNKALQRGKFPKPWKTGIVRYIYKGNGKDPQDVKSYRPLTLLPAIGKIYEKIINRRIIVNLETRGKLHNKQYGFRPGRSTDDAIIDVLQTIENSEDKYVLGIFLDITGAFDNAWWAKIVVQLNEYGVIGNELNVIKDYFIDRYAILQFRDAKAEKKLTMGCPQGSVLGPTLWIVLFDTFLRLRLPAGCHSFAYADDGLLLVTANSRLGLEDKSKAVCAILEQWSIENRLELSVAKTKVMLLKGQLRRPPIVKIRNQTVQHVQTYKYLGVVLDEKLSFKSHIEYACKKAVDAFYKIGRIGKANWGLGYRSLLTIYKGLGEAILLYGVAAWAHKLELSTYAARLIKAQRIMLLMVCQGYRTLPADSLQILAGVMPIDLKAQQRKEIYWAKRLQTRNIPAIQDRYISEWQNRWQSTTKGRKLYEYWPNVRDRMLMRISIDHYTTQYMTGHGNFASYLHRFGLRESELCATCEVADTPEHVINDCIRYNEQRLELACALAEEYMTFDIKDALNTKVGFDIVSRWLNKIGRIREDEII